MYKEDYKKENKKEELSLSIQYFEKDCYLQNKSKFLQIPSIKEVVSVSVVEENSFSTKYKIKFIQGGLILFDVDYSTEHKNIKELLNFIMKTHVEEYSIHWSSCEFDIEELNSGVCKSTKKYNCIENLSKDLNDKVVEKKHLNFYIKKRGEEIKRIDYEEFGFFVNIGVIR